MTKNENTKLPDSNQAFLIYQDDNGITQVNVRFEDEDVWHPVELIMQLFDASQRDVTITSDRFTPRVSWIRRELTKNFC